MSDPLTCSVCGEPAMVALIEKDGTHVPFCANHIPDEEARETYDELREKGWNGPLSKPVN